jgi:hypothetical protein
MLLLIKHMPAYTMAALYVLLAFHWKSSEPHFFILSFPLADNQSSGACVNFGNAEGIL